MAANNLKVIYDNVIDYDSTTITATNSGTYVAANLKRDAKSQTWRSSTKPATLTVGFGSGTFNGYITGTTLVVTSTPTITLAPNQVITGAGVTAGTYITAFGTGTGGTGNYVINTSQTVGSSGTPIAITAANTKTLSGVLLAFTNLTSTATITTTATGVTAGVNPSTLGAVLCRPWSDTAWDSTFLPANSSSYSYGAGTHARSWFSSDVTCTGLTILISDTANTNSYLEASRLIVGKSWSPKYNTEFGIEVGVKDLSSQSRTESGDLITTRGVRYKTLNFNLNWLTYTDRTTFVNLLKTNGLSRPLAVSLFPNNTDDWDAEGLYQIVGKLTDTAAVTHPMFSVYTSSVSIEEI
jgi:hypothetical protein